MVTWIRRNAIALVALFVALGGVGYAASEIDGKDIENRSIAGKKLKNETLGGKQIDESKLGEVPKSLTADALGGIPASGFTRPDCGTSSGAIKGFVQVDASSSLSTSFSTNGITSSYNCSGGAVLVRRAPPSADTFGGFLVQFSGNDARMALATHQFLGSLNSNEGPGDIRFVTAKRAPETFSVQAFGTANEDLQDFNLLIY